MRHAALIFRAFLPVLMLTAAVVADDALLPATGELRPAEVYFGSYRRNEPLADHPEQWAFVREHADGFLMHFGFWLNNDYKADPVATAKKLGPLLKAAKLRTLMEIGWPRMDEPPEIAADMGRHFGRTFADKIKTFETATGVRVDEIECELRQYVFRIVADRFPEFSADDVARQITGVGPAGRATRAYWPEFLTLMRAELGDRPINVGWPPVYVPWKGLFTAGTNMNFARTVDTVDKKPKPGAPVLHFDGPAFTDAILSTPTQGFLCDSPWYLMGNPKHIEQGYLKKIVDVGRFVQKRGKVFSFIVNASPDKTLPPAEWDRQYAEQSMKSLVTYQLQGGRADRYVFESWYVGPYAIVPETEPDTFTGLVRRGLLFLKGPGQTLQLATTPEGNGRHRVTLTNTGSAACLPAVRVRSKGAVIVRLGDTDVTAEARQAEGVTARALLEPAASIDLTIEGDADLEAAWNPQDPQSAPRAIIQCRSRVE